MYFHMYDKFGRHVEATCISDALLSPSVTRSCVLINWADFDFLTEATFIRTSKELSDWALSLLQQSGLVWTNPFAADDQHYRRSSIGFFLLSHDLLYIYPRAVYQAKQSISPLPIYATESLSIQDKPSIWNLSTEICHLQRANCEVKKIMNK
jgi:hypothetical protein